MAYPERCPVCKGNGLVPKGIYEKPFKEEAINFTGNVEKCKACDGKGFVIVPTSDDMFDILNKILKGMNDVDVNS